MIYIWDFVTALQFDKGIVAQVHVILESDPVFHTTYASAPRIHMILEWVVLSDDETHPYFPFVHTHDWGYRTFVYSVFYASDEAFFKSHAFPSIMKTMTFTCVFMYVQPTDLSAMFIKTSYSLLYAI